MNPEPRREAMEIVDIVGEEGGPFEPLPLPYRRVDVNAPPAWHPAHPRTRRRCWRHRRDREGIRAAALRPPRPPREATRPASETAEPVPPGTYHTRHLGHPARRGTFPAAPC